MRRKSLDTYSIEIINQLTELILVTHTIEELSKEWDFSLKLINNINLAVEEIVSNILFYAYSDNQEHIISITFKKNTTHLAITIIDDGKPFNLLDSESPNDLNSSADDRKVGGLGIHIVKKITDTIAYKRVGEKNVIKLTILL